MNRKLDPHTSDRVRKAQRVLRTLPMDVMRLSLELDAS
jgi:hypothetical protein